jgi:hypothetical protein
MTTQSINQANLLFYFGPVIGKTRRNGYWAAIRHFAAGIVKPPSVRRWSLGKHQNRSFSNGHF